MTCCFYVLFGREYEDDRNIVMEQSTLIWIAQLGRKEETSLESEQGSIPGGGLW